MNGHTDDPDKVEEVDAKSEDERRDELALEALERQRKEAGNSQPNQQVDMKLLEAKPKRKRARDKDAMEVDGQPAAKRHRRAPTAVLLDIGKQRTVITKTTLMNLKPMLYMSAAMSFSSGPAMNVRRGGCTATLLDDNHMLVVGGNAGSMSFGTTEVLDIRRNTFFHGPRMRTQRSGCSTIMIDSSRLLVIGGHDGAKYQDTCEIMNLTTREFSPGPRMTMRRAAASVARIDSRYLIVVGGKNDTGCTERTEVLDLHRTTLSFVRGPNLRKPRAGSAVAPIDKTRLLVIGGHDDATTHDTTEILHLNDMTTEPPTMSFTLGQYIGTPRSYFASVMLNAGHMHIIGGHDGLNCLESTEVVRLATMEFTTGPNMSTGRFMCAATTIQEGQVLVVGGTNGSSEHHTTELLKMPTYDYLPAPWMNRF